MPQKNVMYLLNSLLSNFIVLCYCDKSQSNSLWFEIFPHVLSIYISLSRNFGSADGP